MLQMMDDDDDDECGAAGGINDRGYQSTGRKPIPVPLCLSQITSRPDLGCHSGKPATNDLRYNTANY
jgi:hypothetical protein